MASKELIQASTNLKSNLNQIVTVQTNLSEDAVPLFKLNQLRYMLTSAMSEVENISKIYAQYDTPFKLFNATWVSNPDLSQSNQDTNDLCHDKTVENSSDDVILLKNDETKSVPIITLSPDKDISENSTHVDDTESSLSDAQTAQPVFQTTTKDYWLDFVRARSASSSSQSLPGSSENLTNERPNQNVQAAKPNEVGPCREVQAISNKHRISARELLAKRCKINAPLASKSPSFMSTQPCSPKHPPKHGSKPAYLNTLKHFKVVKNQSHFKVVKRQPFTPQSHFKASKVPMVKFCRMCGYFTRIINQFQGKTYDVCRNCKFTNNYS